MKQLRELADFDSHKLGDSNGKSPLPLFEKILSRFTPRLKLLATLFSQGDGHLAKDLFQEGVLGLLRAAKLFDPKRGTKFSTYAEWYMRGAMQNFLRSESKYRTLRSISDHSWRSEIDEEVADDELPRTATECRQDVDNFLLVTDLSLLRNQIKSIEAEFTARQRQIFGLRFRVGLTPSEIARLIKVSPARVSQVLSEAVSKLRQLAQLN